VMARMGQIESMFGEVLKALRKPPDEPKK
jgi:hypothetical protein